MVLLIEARIIVFIRFFDERKLIVYEVREKNEGTCWKNVIIPQKNQT